MHRMTLKDQALAAMNTKQIYITLFHPSILKLQELYGCNSEFYEDPNFKDLYNLTVSKLNELGYNESIITVANEEKYDEIFWESHYSWEFVIAELDNEKERDFRLAKWKYFIDFTAAYFSA